MLPTGWDNEWAVDLIRPAWNWKVLAVRTYLHATRGEWSWIKKPILSLTKLISLDNNPNRPLFTYLVS